jgi:hypothetical protein
LPHAPIDEETMGEALWLERNYWKAMTNAIAAGIKQAL